jgi:hypothetical protein
MVVDIANSLRVKPPPAELPLFLVVQRKKSTLKTAGVWVGCATIGDILF